MPQSARKNAPARSLSLEQILWRAMDRVQERPTLVDADEFAEHIAGIFEGDVPAEAWVERFFDGADKMHRAPADVAEAIVRATADRLHVYEFELQRAEYVIVEDEKQVVVVSDFGQFALQNDDRTTRAISSAVIPHDAPERKDRRASDPRAYFVRKTGEVLQIDVKKVAGALQQLVVRQVSAPVVDKPAARLAPFKPVKRAASIEREASVLRQDPRTRQIMPLPARLQKAAERYRKPQSAPPAAAKTALFVLMPDGQLARAEIGAANRWRSMVSTVVANGPSTEVTGAQRITIQAGNVVAIINRTGGMSMPGAVGQQSLQRGQALAAVRGDAAPVRILRDEEFEKAMAAGAKVLPGLQHGDRFWVQPERAFKPAEGAPEQVVTAGQPVRLGEITGDPWADWALTGGGEMPAAAMAALRGRTRAALRAALDRPSGDDDALIPPALAARVRNDQGGELSLSGAPVIGFRAPDGSVLVARQDGAIRLAAVDRSEAGLLQPVDLALPAPTTVDLAPRSGAVPATALASLQLALEKTAAAGGYKLPSSMSLTSAIDALDAGDAMQLDDDDARRFSVRLARSPVLGGASGTTAQLVLSMPFPNDGEIHVGNDLAEALNAYLATPMAPSYTPMAAAGAGALAGAALGGGLLVKLRGGQQPALDADGLPMDWAALHRQAASKAQDAVVTLDLPEVQPLVAGGNAANLPFLLRRALSQSTDWVPAPDMAMPPSIRSFALAGPFDALLAADAQQDLPAQALRPLNPGEEEIVIPLPLWAQMGRGQLSETDQIMASPLAADGYNPPLGVYRLVLPEGGPFDLTGGAPSGTPGVVDLAGPMGLELVARRTGSPVVASSLGGYQSIARVAIDDGQTGITRTGRIPIGEPADPTPAFAQPSTADAADADAAAQPPSDTMLSQGGVGADDSPTVVSGAPPDSPPVDTAPATFVDGNYTAAPSSVSSPMAGALSSALSMSDQVGARTAPPTRPGNIGSADGSPAATQGSSGGSAAFSSSAQAAGQASAAATMPSSTSSSSASSPNQTLVVSGAQGASTGAQLGSSAAGASSAAQDAATASSAAQTSVSQAADSSSTFQPPTPAFVTGLQPGMWSGHDRRTAANYQDWTYTSQAGDDVSTYGGVPLSSLAKPVYPSLPTALRFRYVGAPLWWSSSVGGDATASEDGSDDGSTPGTRAMRSGLAAATASARMWRSILVASPQWGGGPVDDVPGAMDQDRAAGATDMSSLARGLDLLTAGSMVSGAAAGSGVAYIATTGSGSAGLVSGNQATNARADSVEMSIVAAVPPRPPPLESMGTSGGDAPHARSRGGAGHSKKANEHKEGGENPSHSKIEGSVDAIAQRIYHRIRRRIESDRERFGG